MNNRVLSFNSLVDYKQHQIRSRSLNKSFGIELPMMIYALDKGESISEELTSLTKLIQVTDGVLEILLDGQSHQLAAGEMIVISPMTMHGLQAHRPCKFVQMETV